MQFVYITYDSQCCSSARTVSLLHKEVRKASPSGKKLNGRELVNTEARGNVFQGATRVFYNTKEVRVKRQAD